MLPIIRREANRWSVRKKNSQFDVIAKTRVDDRRQVVRGMTIFIESNKAIVRRYFEEVLDKRKLDTLDEIVATECVIHRPGVSEPIRGLEAFRQALDKIYRCIASSRPPSFTM